MMLRFTNLPFSLAIGLLAMANGAHAASETSVQKRIDADLAAGRPIIVQVVVALCDNANQGIVPVRPALGNGQNPKTNLYWGARYGFRTHLVRQGGFKRLAVYDRPEPGILQKIVLFKRIGRSGKPCPVFVVGEAWDGGRMKAAIDRFLSFAAGRNPLMETVEVGNKRVTLAAGGSSALVVFVGHNGLMDFDLNIIPDGNKGSPPRGSVVLACASKDYFLDVLRRGGSHPLLLTTGLMAPEAYTLDAIIHELSKGEPPAKIHDAAAAAYHRYQKCGVAAAKKLFYWGTDAQR